MKKLFNILVAIVMVNVLLTLTVINNSKQLRAQQETISLLEMKNEQLEEQVDELHETTEDLKIEIGVMNMNK